MKRFLVLFFILAMVSCFLTGCVSSQTGQVSPVGKGNPTVVVVDNSFTIPVDLFIDGIFQLSTNPRNVGRVSLSDKRGYFILSIKSKDGRGYSHRVYMTPGEKISISVFNNGEGMVASFSEQVESSFGYGYSNYYDGRRGYQYGPFVGDGMMRIHNSHLKDFINQREKRRGW